MPSPKKLTTSEMLRLACIYAERDQDALVDAYGGDDLEQAVVDAKQFVKQVRAYRTKRWGKTQIEEVMENSVAVSVTKFLKKE